MFLVGLTGGIAAGKSTVAELWDSLGAQVIDADDLARRVVEPNSTGLKQIVEAFGNTVLNYDGTLNRGELANLVFHDFALRKKLESITHPLIRDLAQRLISDSKADIVVYVIPLLVESKSELDFDFVVTVEAPQSDQIKRMIENRGMSESGAQARVNSQATPADRANVADRILSSNQSLSLLLNDAKVLFKEIERMAREKVERDVGRG
jgi:dephospho-CoA kinase